MPVRSAKINLNTKRVDHGKAGEVKNATIKQLLWDHGGLLTKVAKDVGMCRSGVWKRIKKSQELQDAYEDSKEYNLDEAEHALMEKVRQGNLGAICFYLKCKGKARGYIENQRWEHSFDNEKFTVQVVDYSKAPVSVPSPPKSGTDDERK